MPDNALPSPQYHPPYHAPYPHHTSTGASSLHVLPNAHGLHGVGADSSIDGVGNIGGTGGSTTEKQEGSTGLVEPWDPQGEGPGLTLVPALMSTVVEVGQCAGDTMTGHQ